MMDAHPDEVRIAFDGDAVLFSDEAERVFQAKGLDAFQAHEADHAAKPLPPGSVQAAAGGAAPAAAIDCRSVADARAHGARHRAQRPAHERAIRTLMDWNIDDRRGDVPGRPARRARSCAKFEPDFFFDDQTRHVESASRARSVGPRAARRGQRGQAEGHMKMSAAGPPQGANGSPSGGSAAADSENEAASVGVH